MELEEIYRRLRNIENISDDDEVAHCKEKELFVDFVKYIAENDQTHLGAKAKLILTVEKIEFCRWFA